MPIYEYVCDACQAHFEILQKINDPLLTECRHCHQPEVKRLVSSAGFRLKGGGWYETDFKTNNTKKNLVDKPNESSSSDKDSTT